ncbi:lipase [Escherichia coli]|uniref:Lipase n=1 Tax=Escherichia coli TaxID=562 RepID=A0A376Y0J4_ECOLX|nr:lipase [Escherichia coli]
MNRFTTGPVAALHYDGTTTSMYNEFGDSTTTLTDPLWHASVSTLGWRVDSRLGDLRPWAQISYNQQFWREYLEGAIRPEPDDGDKPERQLAGCHRRR